MATCGILAVGAAELSLVLILLCVIVVPIAAVAFARSGRAYDEIGKGRFAVEFDESGEAEQREEIRQLVEAKAYRQARRGEQPVDVEAEVERLLAGHPPGEQEGLADAAAEPPPPEVGPDPETAAIREEIRQVVIAGNERRERRGEPPLEVEAEVDRMLEEYG